MPFVPYIIKTFRGGFSDETDKGVSGSFKNGFALDIHKRVDSLIGGSAMATILDASTGGFADGAGRYAGGAGTTQTGIIQFFVPAADGSTYCFSSTGSIFCRSGDKTDNIWTFVYNDENGKIKGAHEWKDTSGSGQNYLFWATDTSLARKALPGTDITPDSGSARWTDATQDWRATLSGAEWHTMDIASGVLAISNGNFLATLDNVMNFNASSLNIAPGNVLKCLEERDDYVIMGSNRLDDAEEGHLWSWISTATNWVQKKRIPIKGVNAIISAELNILQGGQDGEIFFSDFATAIPLHAIPGRGQANPGGATVWNKLAAFGIYGAGIDNPGIWTYGRSKKNRPYALNYEYRLVGTINSSTISTIGAIANINADLLASWGTTDGSTSEYGIDQVSATTSATYKYESLEFDGGTPHIKHHFDTVKLILTPLPSGTSLSVRYKTDNASTAGDSSAGAGWKYAVLGDGTTTFSQSGAVEAVFSIGGAANIYELGIDGNPSGASSPEVRRIITYVSKEGYEYA